MENSKAAGAVPVARYGNLVSGVRIPCSTLSLLVSGVAKVQALSVTQGLVPS